MKVLRRFLVGFTSVAVDAFSIEKILQLFIKQLFFGSAVMFDEVESLKEEIRFSEFCNRREEVGVSPESVASSCSSCFSDAVPHGGGFPDHAWAKLKPDEGREGAFRRA